ncbi:MAG: KxYKxGKxW signal peptide domain-containing protein [Bacilli bacterium]|nr:KxYKxGKxW signal peptide domain-containing protein [Bacilli bacterium]
MDGKNWVFAAISAF